MTSNGGFSSQGFDLDAAAGDTDNVVFELGGGVTKETVEKPATLEKEDDPLIQQAESYKKDGNEQFKLGNYLDAWDMYTEAINACPGMTGEELLKLKEEFEEQERARVDEEFRQAEAERRQRRREGGEEKEEDDKPSVPPEMKKFKVPPHEYGGKLAIYYSNRAACLSHLKRYEEAVSDCNVAILLNPKYTKAYLRRSNAYESTERIDEALADAKEALALDPTNSSTKKTVARLQKLEDERMEKLKEETMGKLKDLGNSLLSNFGLSMDNFKAVQDPNTGSYSISFDNNAGKKNDSGGDGGTASV